MTNEDYAEPAAALSTGPMPLLGFGTWQISESQAPEATATALEAGYRHIDTATAYRNEGGIGRALAASRLPREAVFVTTKLPAEHAGRERATIERSLEQLGTEYVDLWLIHSPPDRRASPAVWEQLIRAQQDGLTRAIGVSNYSLDQIDELTQATGVTPAVNQIRWGPAVYDAATAEGLAQRGVVLEGYSPFRASNLDDPTLRSIADARRATPAQIIVAWHIAHGFVVIPKSAQPERIAANAAGARIELSDDEVTSIDNLA